MKKLPACPYLHGDTVSQYLYKYAAPKGVRSISVVIVIIVIIIIIVFVIIVPAIIIAIIAGVISRVVPRSIAPCVIGLRTLGFRRRSVIVEARRTRLLADYIVDIGPGAGIHGGEIVCAGSVEDIKKCENSITGQYLSGRKTIPVPTERREGNGKFIEVINATENNLKGIDVKIPLGKFVAVTGVSGSGKSSLVNEIIYKRLVTELNGAKKFAGKHEKMTGVENLDKVIDIDQSPIGRTPRSNPATYTGVFNDIRELFALTSDSKAKGYKANRFSFNVKGGRCESCQGDGIVKIEMHFLPDIFVPCEVCDGKRYNRETLEIKYKGKNIYDVLEMTIEEVFIFEEGDGR